MFKFDNYKSNLDVIDKFNVKNLHVNKSVIFNGDINIFTEQTLNEEKSQPKPLAAAILGINNTGCPLPTNDRFYDAWTDIDAQELYLNSKPTCYLILSKPGAGAFSLGEAISKKLNCVHLCPRNIINDELEQESPTGLCLDFNMKHNKICQFDTILSILKIKLQSSAVQHRGYVISGFPLVTSSRSSHYLFNTLYGEESVLTIEEMMYDLICNLKKKKPKKANVPTETSNSSITTEVAGEEAPEEEQEPENALEEEEQEQSVELPKFLLDSCSDIIFSKKPYFDTKKITLLQQVNALLNLTIKPDIIMFITCPDIDLVTKKSHKYLNYTNSQNTIDPLSKSTKLESELRWPIKYTISDYIDPYNSHVFNPKYNCTQPINFKEKSIEQMCNYQQHIFPFVEKILEDFDPKQVIKLDGRNSVHQMMYHVNEILLLMSIKQVLIPEPLYLEEPSEDIEEFWKSVEELNVIRDGVVTFKRYASPWFNRCPVELKNRQSVRGNPKFAVTLFKHVYLLSSLNAMVSFCRNPRPFLKLKYLEPTCRIIVLGTKSSGKTMISECLSWIFDASIIPYNEFLDSEKKKKYDSFAKTILSEIIATIEDNRFATWQRSEMLRFSYLDEWCNSTLTVLRTYIPLLIQSLKHSEKKALSEEEHVSEIEESPDYEFLNNFNTLKIQLSFLPILDDVEKCVSALEKNNIAQYAPVELITMTTKPYIPALGDEDVMEAISAYIIANELQKEIEPTIEELMNEIVKILSTIDAECQQATKNEQAYGKYIFDGFPSDPEYWGYLSESKLMPDYTVALIENREIEPDLFNYYTNIDKYRKNYQERFLSANDTLIKTKLQSKKVFDLKVLNMQIIIHDLLTNIFDSKFIENSAIIAEAEAEILTSFSESINKFRENWDNLKLKLDENYKAFIEIELENKSDIQVAEEVLLKVRKSYFISCMSTEDEPGEHDDEDEVGKDILTYNNPQHLCETNIYCPITYYDYGVLWEGKSELCVQHNNKNHYFCKEECSEIFQKDVTKYQSYNIPYKKLPPLRICVIGCIGSGKTTLSKQLAKELGLLHIDFSEIINDYLMPRHFKKVGRQYENSFSDVPIDDEAGVEFQIDEEKENIVSDILSNEKELRRIVYNYFELGEPIVSVLMQRLIKKFWFQNPFMSTGFVLDGYPRLPADVQDMISCFCVPDIIIELESNTESALSRLSPVMFKTWKMQLNEAKNMARTKLDKERKEWMNFIAKNVVAKLIFDEVFENVFFSFDEPVKVLSTESVIIDAHPSGSSNVDANLFNTYNGMIQEFPEPIDQSEWEKPEEAREKIDARIENIFEVNDENIQALKDLLLEQRIKTLSINGTNTSSKIFRNALSKLSNLRNRTESFFEQTYIISLDIAEMLLLEGFCLLSKFYRMCPVYIFEKPHTIINPYKISRRKRKVFPVIHRSYIYFVCGDENLIKFRINPLKYVTGSNIISYVEYPLRISVIGPPKSGKSALVEKLAKRFGLFCISRGMAIRNVLENMHWTELGSKMFAALRLGKCVDTDFIMKAVQTVAIDHRTVTHGFVFDGFPESPSEAMQLSQYGLYPNIVLDISTHKDTILWNSQTEIYSDILKSKPPYSVSFIEHRFIKWHKNCYRIRDWINNDYQNLYVLDGNKSRWQCIKDANNIINEFIFKAHNYLTNVHTSIVPLDVMCISNEIFQQRMSNFKNLCPLCLRHNVLRHSGYPVDRKGVVQFENKFFWVCVEHMNEVLKRPHRYLSFQKVDLPEVPAVVKTIDVTLVYENGVCIVSYAENLPAQKIAIGSNKFAASFKGKTYLFCSYNCLEKFLAKPHMYFDVVVFKETKPFPKLTLKKLPNIGYLEQTVGNIITDACCSVNVVRPKYPGLSFPLSALIYIALYLKIHNPIINGSTLPMYVKASKVYDARCKLIKDMGLFLRSMDNPFANYPQCCRSIQNSVDSGTFRKPSSVSTSSARVSLVVSEFK